MISTRRMAAVLALAAGASALAAPAASADISPTGTLDSLAASSIPAEHRAEVPSVTNQLDGLNGLYELQQLHQLTDLAAPVTGLLPAVQ